jgi:hypothetical protein
MPRKDIRMNLVSIGLAHLRASMRTGALQCRERLEFRGAFVPA